VEVCSAVAIASILSCSAWPNLARWIDNARMQGRSQELTGDLLLLRSQAIARNQDLRITIHSDEQGTCYVLHDGGPRDCTCSSQGTSQCESPTATVLKSMGFPKDSGLSVQSSARSILFDPLLGGTAPGGTIRLIDRSGLEIRHIVSLRGRIRTCAPGTGISGHPSC
jgi:type IV fimbrial biogenesis protein FimT